MYTDPTSYDGTKLRVVGSTDFAGGPPLLVAFDRSRSGMGKLEISRPPNAGHGLKTQKDKKKKYSKYIYLNFFIFFLNLQAKIHQFFFFFLESHILRLLALTKLIM